MKIAITTTTFAKYDSSILDELNKANIEYILNPYGKKLNQEQVIELANGVDGLIAGTEKIDSYVLENLPNLKVISRCGVGIDNIDLGKANELNIKIVNTPFGPTKAVAELAVALILNILRKITQMDRELRKGIWKKQMGNLLYDKKVGIIGFGRIGQAVADLLHPFGTTIFYYDLEKKIYNDSYIYKELNDIISESDILSLHLSSNSNQQHLFTTKEFNLMKSGAWLVNLSRGGVVDEDALYDALKSDKIAGAAIDVYETEPYHGKFCELDNVILTPHIGSYALEARNDMESQSISNLIIELNRKKKI